MVKWKTKISWYETPTVKDFEANQAITKLNLTLINV